MLGTFIYIGVLVLFLAVDKWLFKWSKREVGLSCYFCTIGYVRGILNHSEGAVLGIIMNIAGLSWLLYMLRKARS